MEGEPIAPPVASGWRVVYLLKRAPWVREEPVGAFRLHEHHATPMVLDDYRTSLVDVDEERTPYALARPGEPASSFIEDAKERAREHRRWLRATRDKRADEKRIKQIQIELLLARADFERQGRTIPPGHPALEVLPTFWSHGDVLKEAGLVGLAWFLAEHCELARNLEVAVDPLKAGLGNLLAAYDLPMLDGASLSRAMRSAGFEPLKYRGKIDGWTGIGLREKVPDEAIEDPEGEDAFRQRSVIGGVFTAHCLRKAQFEGSATQTRMLTAFRCWCIRFRLKPWSAKELARELRIQAPLSRSAGRSGEREYEGVSVFMPRPDEFAFATERARRRRHDS